MIRIVGGKFSGRRLTTPRGRKTRPTADRVREGLFNTLDNQLDWEAMRVLDLFAGSGALGIEALSRGAACALFVEKHPPTAALIRSNLTGLGLAPQEGRVVTGKAEVWLKKPSPGSLFDLVFLDPPYDYPGYREILSQLIGHPRLAPGAWLVVESAREKVPPLPDGLETFRRKGYGDTEVNILRITPSGTVESLVEGPN